MDPARALELLASAPVARLATVRPDGRADLVPFVFAFTPDGRLVSAVDHKPKRSTRLQRLVNIAANPEVTVLADHYEADWSQLWWARARGRAELVGAERERNAALAALVKKYPQYAQRRPDGPVIAVELTEVTAWHA